MRSLPGLPKAEDAWTGLTFRGLLPDTNSNSNSRALFPLRSLADYRAKKNALFLILANARFVPLFIVPPPEGLYAQQAKIARFIAINPGITLPVQTQFFPPVLSPNVIRYGTPGANGALTFAAISVTSAQNMAVGYPPPLPSPIFASPA
jgi:hypothetical protein